MESNILKIDYLMAWCWNVVYSFGCNISPFLPSPFLPSPSSPPLLSM